MILKNQGAFCDFAKQNLGESQNRPLICNDKGVEKNKKKGTLVILHFLEKPGFVMSERLGDKIPISENGMHYGVLL